MASCNNKNPKENESNENSKIETNHHEGESKVSLNKGEAWEANQETTDGINKMIQLMDDYTETENVEAYKSLSDTLDSEFNLIFKKCTMKGEAHNQLHNYLFPMKAKFKSLASGDLTESKAAFGDLKEHLTEYKTYFQ
jgi:hypothetical protein